MEFIIEPDKCGEGFNIYTIDEWPKSSVLAGMTRKTFIDAYNSTKEAQYEYPNAEVLDYVYEVSGDIGPCPTSDFDPSYAGETWNDDY